MAPLEAKSKIFKNERLQWMLRWMQSLATDSSYFDVMAFSLLAVEVLLLIFIINFVSCKMKTEVSDNLYNIISYRHRD